MPQLILSTIDTDLWHTAAFLKRHSPSHVTISPDGCQMASLCQQYCLSQHFPLQCGIFIMREVTGLEAIYIAAFHMKNANCKSHQIQNFEL